MSWTVIEMDGNGVRETRRGGTLAGDQAETKPKPKPKPKMVTWRLCTRPNSGVWMISSCIRHGWIPMESQTSPYETVKQLPEGEEP